MRNLPNNAMLFALRALGPIPASRRRMHQISAAFYYLGSVSGKMRRNNRLARINIAHAFPEWGADQVEKVFWGFWRSQAIASIYESPVIGRKCYLDLSRRMDPALPADKSAVVWEGLEHIEAARGHPVIFSVPHMHSLEIAIIAASLRRRLCYMSKDPKTPLIRQIVNDNRDTLEFARHIDHTDVRAVLSRLREGKAIAILCDQHIEAPNPITVEFFARPILVQPTISKLAGSSGAKVIPVYIRRTGDMRHIISFKAPLEMSAGDHRKNTQLVFRHVEQCIRQCPEQYIWNHNRFFH